MMCSHFVLNMFGGLMALVFKTFMDACEIENFEGRILGVGDSLSLSVFHL